MQDFGHKVKIIKHENGKKDIYVDDQMFHYVTEYEVKNAVNEAEIITMTFYANVEIINETKEKT